jgi:uncharacterized protein YcbK (DUF882 family)
VPWRPRLEAAIAATFGARPLAGEPAQATPELVLESPAGRRLAVRPFDARGNADPEAFAALSDAFRATGGERAPVDPSLAALLLSLSLAFEGRPIVLLSGHRAPGRGTRRTSYHVRGMAADIAIRGVSTRELRAAAIRLGAPGVGIYPSFVHVDVRRDAPYRWAGAGPRPRQPGAVGPSPMRARAR